MEGLRGVAVFLVFWVHYSSLINPWLSGYSVPISNFMHEMGNLGVDLFFVLSGYLIYGSILDKPTFAPIKYGKRRIQRIYPTFLIVLLLYIALSFLFPSESKLPESSFARFNYIAQNLLFLPGIFSINPIITVAWSLSYEVFYYIAIPCLILLLRIKSWRIENRLAFWCTVATLGFICFSLWSGPIRLLMFISGIFLFELHSKKKITLSSWGTRCLIAALALFGFRTFFDVNYELSLAIIFVLFVLLCLCAFNPKSNAYKWLTFTPIRWLGNMSYSYYLIHGLTLKFSFTILGFMTQNNFTSNTIYYWLWVPLFALTLISSFFLFWAIERPLSLKTREIRW